VRSARLRRWRRERVRRARSGLLPLYDAQAALGAQTPVGAVEHDVDPRRQFVPLGVNACARVIQA
jgi:hypothetical protein